MPVQAHMGKREEARRLRKTRPSKYERYFFRAVPSLHVTYHWGPFAEAVDLGTERRRARDEEELLTLVKLVAAGAVVVAAHLVGSCRRGAGPTARAGR
jgi:hypothetical protein